MAWRVLLVLLLLPLAAQAQDCTAEADVASDLKVDVALACRGAQPERYTVDLLALPRSREVIVRGEGVLATLGAWLHAPDGATVDLRVRTAPGLSFAAGLPKAGDVWQLRGVGVRFAGYTAIGRLSLSEFGSLRVAVLDGVSDAGRAELLDWVRRIYQAETAYWGAFAPQMLVGLVPTPMRRAVGYGRTVSGGGPTVMVEVAPEVDRAGLMDDWVLPHELVHTAMPFVRGRATWFMEGAATYIEPIIRARAGWKSEEEVWREWIDNMPRGVAVFESGLQTASGQQNYWGGALFMLLADIALRRDTDGRLGLEDCLKGALARGFGGSRRAGLDEYVAACDAATGTKSLSMLVDRHVARGQPVNLATLWRELGLSVGEGRLLLDDTAPLARWRKMIVMGRK